MKHGISNKFMQMTMFHNVTRSYIIDSGDNLSDHLPICFELQLKLEDSGNVVKNMEHKQRRHSDGMRPILFHIITILTVISLV